jgi:hypothetical protein
MTSQTDFVQPPRIATWLVNLFASPEEAESILGDLLEEFTELATKSGVACARRWYWRQTTKTIVHLAGTGFRGAPWSTSAVVVGGFLLHGFVSGLPDKVLSAVTDRYLAYWSAHFKAYMFVASDGMLIAHIMLSMFIGCLVALTAKGREMVATMTLSLILCAMTGIVYVASIAQLLAAEDTLWWMLAQLAGPFAIVAGGAIVHSRRSTSTALPSSA